MRTRRWITWLVFAIGALAVLEGLGWVTWQALRLERREMAARADAQQQEAIRLTLWRMESELTPLIAQEAARPYFHYWPFYPAERAYTRMWQEVQPGEVLVPSPLLDSSGQFVRLHFQIAEGGQVSSPQVPSGNMRDLAESQYVDSEFIVLAGHMLDELSAMVRARPLDVPLAAAPAEQAEPLAQQSEAAAPAQIQAKQDFAARQQAAQTANIPYETRNRSKVAAEPKLETQVLADAKPLGRETGAPRDKSEPAPSMAVPAAPAAAPGPIVAYTEGAPAPAAAADQGPQLKKAQGPGHSPESIHVEQGPLVPLWRTSPISGREELLFRRAVSIQGRQNIQGFWIDWPALRTRLLAAGGGLLPAAALTPVHDDATETAAPSARRLASIPILLTPGAISPLPTPVMTPTHITLIFTWLAVIAAIIAIGVVLRTAMELGDRRGRFVSAVTHELRTPLTTFCLYTEMLADGMVREDSARREYLATLKGESRRLAGIVENVLDYARLGNTRRTNGHADLAAADLLRQVLPALERRAAQGGMDLVAQTGGLDGCMLRTDAPTFERILLNLVDNACKYAAGAADHRIHLTATCLPGRRPLLEVLVRDHGPGIPDRDRRKVFLPFHRSRRDADGPKSGLGLGLALARGLARGLGGDLTLGREWKHGAEFRLILPLNTRP